MLSNPWKYIDKQLSICVITPTIRVGNNIVFILLRIKCFNGLLKELQYPDIIKKAGMKKASQYSFKSDMIIV